MVVGVRAEAGQIEEIVSGASHNAIEASRPHRIQEPVVIKKTFRQGFVLELWPGPRHYWRRDTHLPTEFRCDKRGNNLDITGALYAKPVRYVKGLSSAPIGTLSQEQIGYSRVRGAVGPVLIVGAGGNGYRQQVRPYAGSNRDDQLVRHSPGGGRRGHHRVAPGTRHSHLHQAQFERLGTEYLHATLV